MIALLCAIGFLACAILIYFCAEGTQTAITYERRGGDGDPQTDGKSLARRSRNTDGSVDNAHVSPKAPNLTQGVRVRSLSRQQAGFESRPTLTNYEDGNAHTTIPYFATRAIKGFSRTPGAICCVFCGSSLVWDATDQVWDCACVAARRSRVRVS